MTQTQTEEAAHQGHDVSYCWHSWGSTLQCNTCRVVVTAWSEGGEEPLGYIPAGVRYLGPPK